MTQLIHAQYEINRQAMATFPSLHVTTSAPLLKEFIKDIKATQLLSSLYKTTSIILEQHQHHLTFSINPHQACIFEIRIPEY
jgi:hypothetical protein